VEKFVTKNLVL